ncbi:MAG: hypothetical protein E2O57_06545 [Gammaproteobacteria bacterium]|nr:MAG: hypothetical protein E2O57_06545 [Gammaproteobacteria bacterium]
MTKSNIEVKINPEIPEMTLAPKQFVRAAPRVSRRYQMENRVAVRSFDWRVLPAIYNIAPDIASAYLSVNQPLAE